MARVDIVMPVRDGARYIDEAISSVRAQDVTDWRLVVLDHGSRDASAAIANRHAETDRRIEVRDCSHLPTQSGLRNFGFDVTDSEFILLHDADDRSRPDRIRQLSAGMEAHKHATVIGSECRLINESGRQQGLLRRLIEPERIAVATLFCNPTAQPTVMFRRSGVARHDVRYGKDFLGLVCDGEAEYVTGAAADYLLFGQLGLLGECVNLPLPLVDYRRHTASVSTKARDVQLRVSLSVSRFLMRSLAVLKSVEYVDPAPFCNHGATLYALPAPLDLDRSFAKIAAALRRAFGTSAAVERELSYRQTLATRKNMDLVLRHLRFRLRERCEMDEAWTMRSWLSGALHGGGRFVADPDEALSTCPLATLLKTRR